MLNVLVALRRVSNMRRILVMLLKRIWILPVAYLFIYKMRINEKYPNTFMLIMLALTALLLVYDFYRVRRKIH